MSHLEIVTIYRNPRDFPEPCYVAMVDRIRGGGKVERVSTPLLIAQPTDEGLRVLRRHMEDMGLTRMDRHPTDDPVIVETWL